ncbi:MAG: CcdB family protein [Rhodocyclaceae bacterium]|nr:CcdB family protein [Rhodocyclaceae bacterium]
MAQFDVHRNNGRNRDDIPYVVLVQSSLYDSYRRRVVVPLVRKASLGKISNARFNPTFKIEGTAVVLHPLEIVSVANDQLGDFVKSLEAEGGRIMDALDELLTRAWG